MDSSIINNHTNLFPQCAFQKPHSNNYYKVIEGLATRCDQKDSYLAINNLASSYNYAYVADEIIKKLKSGVGHKIDLYTTLALMAGPVHVQWAPESFKELIKDYEPMIRYNGLTQKVLIINKMDLKMKNELLKKATNYQEKSIINNLYYRSNQIKNKTAHDFIYGFASNPDSEMYSVKDVLFDMLTNKR